MAVSAAAGTGPVRYYLFINGLDGGSTDPGFENAFKVDSAALGVADGDGKAAYDMLDMVIQAGSSLDELMRNVMNGAQTPTARLVAVTGLGKTETIVSEVRLADVFVSHVGITDEATTRLSLGYRSIEVESDNGQAMESFGWNLAANSELDGPIGSPVAGDENATGAFGAVTWSLVFGGLDGGGAGGVFAVGAFDLAMDNSRVLGAGGGSGTGKFTLGDLDLRLELGSASDEILRLLAAGLHTNAVQLVGKAGGQTVYDLRMSDVIVKNAAINSGSLDALSLSSKALSLTTTNKAGTSETIAYNAATTEIGSTQLGPATATLEDGLNTGKTSWYLVIDGMDGGVRVKGHEGAFALAAFSFGGDNPGPKFTASDITLRFEACSSLDELLARLMAGTHISSARIVGDTAVGSEVITGAYDLRLSSLLVKHAAQDSAGQDSFTLDYSAMSLSTKSLGGAVETRSYDKQTTEIGTDPLTPAVASLAESGANPSKATDYYMVIAGLDGGVNTKGHNLAFAIDDFSISAELVTSGGGGSGRGKVEFGALTVDLDLGSSLANLVGRLASDTAFSLQIVGDDPNRKGQTVVYDLRLDAAVLTAINNGSGHDQLVFDYGDFSLTTLNGKGVAETTGIDRETTELLTTPLTAAKGANLDATADQAMKYFLVLDGIDGGSTAKGHKGAFAVSSFDFDMTREDGKSFGTLDLKLNLGSAEDELMRLIATGIQLSSARIVGDTTGKNGKASVYDLRLGDVMVSKLGHDPSNKDELILTFGEASVSTKNAKGQISTWAHDFGTDAVTTTPLPVAKPGSDDWLGGKVTYWLVLDGINSGEGTKNHAGAFALDDFDFTVTQPDSPNSGGGGGMGKPQFSPLNALLDTGAAIDELLALISKGTHLESARIFGEATIGKAVRTVYDLRFSDVTLSDLGLLDDDRLGFDYEAFTLTTLKSNLKTQTYGFDLADATELTKALPPPAVGEL